MKIYLLYIFPLLSSTHTYDFVVLTFLVVLQIGRQEIGKAKDFSAPLRENNPVSSKSLKYAIR
jgi:hypothetical protein